MKNLNSMTHSFIIFSATLRHRHDLWFLFIIAFFLRLGFMLFMLGQTGSDALLDMSNDTIRYVNIGTYVAGLGPADEGAVMVFGPGYGAFLGVLFRLFGVYGIPVLLLQALMSSLTCLLLYRLGHELTGRKSIGYIAGLLSAVSYTSISLSNVLLSDTLFLFLFAAGNLIFLLGLQNRQWRYFILSGLLIGAAILTRTMAQFWPLFMLALIFILPGKDKTTHWHGKRLGLLKRAWIGPAIAILIIATWTERNYIKHELPSISAAGSHGLGRLMATTLNRVDGTDRQEIWDSVVTDYRQVSGKTNLNQTDQHYMKIDAARKVFSRYPGDMINTYFHLIWDNLNAVNEFHYVQLPEYKDGVSRLIDRYRRISANYLAFVLTLAGFILMVVKRDWRPLAFLGLFYVYMLIMIGFGQWQGSRLFFPGQMAWAIVTAYLIVSLTRMVRDNKFRQRL
jgi:4-amino-4-deoxy-L-arabinose transferase-like glycosyltransferase